MSGTENDAYGPMERPDGSLHWERLDWMCQCTPQSECTPERNLNLLVAWAKGNPGSIPTCARCEKPFDLRNAFEAVVPVAHTEREGTTADVREVTGD